MRFLTQKRLARLVLSIGLGSDVGGQHSQGNDAFAAVCLASGLLYFNLLTHNRHIQHLIQPSGMTISCFNPKPQNEAILYAFQKFKFFTLKVLSAES